MARDHEELGVEPGAIAAVGRPGRPRPTSCAILSAPLIQHRGDAEMAEAGKAPHRDQRVAAAGFANSARQTRNGGRPPSQAAVASRCTASLSRCAAPSRPFLHRRVADEAEARRRQPGREGGAAPARVGPQRREHSSAKSAAARVHTAPNAVSVRTARNAARSRSPPAMSRATRIARRARSPGRARRAARRCGASTARGRRPARPARARRRTKAAPNSVIVAAKCAKRATTSGSSTGVGGYIFMPFIIEPPGPEEPTPSTGRSDRDLPRVLEGQRHLDCLAARQRMLEADKHQMRAARRQFDDAVRRDFQAADDLAHLHHAAVQLHLVQLRASAKSAATPVRRSAVAPWFSIVR